MAGQAVTAGRKGKRQSGGGKGKAKANEWRTDRGGRRIYYDTSGKKQTGRTAYGKWKKAAGAPRAGGS